MFGGVGGELHGCTLSLSLSRSLTLSSVGLFPHNAKRQSNATKAPAKMRWGEKTKSSQKADLFVLDIIRGDWEGTRRGKGREGKRED